MSVSTMGGGVRLRGDADLPRTRTSKEELSKEELSKEEL
jgi:hypothetical protein